MEEPQPYSQQEKQQQLQQLQWQRIMSLHTQMHDAVNHRQWPKFQQLLSTQQLALADFFNAPSIAPTLIENVRQDINTLQHQIEDWRQQHQEMNRQLSDQLKKLGHNQRAIHLYQKNEG